jgi:crossover junction endodeoxyribonuclease RuvC
MSGGGAARVNGANSLRVLGVDPGTARTGWGVVERGAGAFAHVAHGTVTARTEASLASKLAAIHAALAECCATWRPDVLALEKSFVGRNVQSAFRLGEVRGVVMMAAAAAGIAVVEYSPAEVKVAATGSGRAEKPQVQKAIARELGLAEAPAADAADALALAVCHLQSARLRALIATPPARRRAAGVGVR